MATRMSPMGKRTFETIWIVSVAMVLCACGYHFTGEQQLPAGVQRVFIPVFENRSSETGVEIRFTNDLIFEFTRRRKANLAPDRSSADGVLRGSIVLLAVDTVSRTTLITAVQRQVTGTVSLRLEAPDGSVLWASGELVESSAYRVVANNKTATDRNKSVAIAAVSRKIAESAYSRLTDDF